MIRLKDLQKARLIFGTALGKCPREEIINAYIEMELQMANVGRARKLYHRFIELFPENPKA
jgi:crooked neck